MNELVKLSKNIPIMIRNKKNIDKNKILLIEENIKNKYENNDIVDKKYDSNYLISVYENLDLFKYVKPIDQLISYLKNNICEKLDNISNMVIRGEFLLSLFLNNEMVNTNIFIHRYVKDEYDMQNDKRMESFLESINSDDKKNITIDKKIYIDPIHVILDKNEWYDQIGYLNGKVIISNTFLLEYITRIKYVNNNDPVIKKNYNLFNKREYSLHKLVDKYNFSKIIIMHEKNYEEIQNNMTPIEKALLLFSKERNIKLKIELKNIISILANHTYIRPPCIYMNYLEIDDNEICSTIYAINSKIKIDNNMSENCDKINKLIITNLIKGDNNVNIIEYMMVYKYIIDADDCENIVKYNSRKILETLIKTNNISIDDSLCCVLLTEAINMIEYLKTNNEYIIEKSKLILKELMIRNKYVSLYYLYGIDKSILNHIFEQGNTILHSLSNNSKDVLKLVLNINPNISLCYNCNNQNILMTNIDKNIDIIFTILKYIDLDNIDNNGNNIIHYVIKYNRIDILKHMLNNKNYSNYLALHINEKNKNGESSLLISTINGNEQMFYILCDIGGNVDTMDNNENTIYHYICKNKICLGMLMKNKPNKYGFTPKDYCEISTDYWKWI